MVELHKILIRYRVIYFMITAFFLWLGFDAWNWYKGNHSTLSEAGTVAFGTFILAVIGALKYVLENLDKNRDHD